ncbi:carboxymuconolactone decarboxylase family protein [Iodidimonas sp. SYSU 1G8]|jgi:AhpD family alkylhydroperoxidase|uniref:carboxymuconolactone decarboxylase family protein n=1 Tax=Iodidimonas sp. SYSU 1G8 TaxID=3133967 RepID=UPI0031FE6210
MTRVAKVEIENWDPELRAMTRADEATPLEQGLMRIFANVPELAKAFVGFGGAMKRTRTLSPRLVELVRLRVAFHNQCRSCMAIRYTEAANDGVTEDLVCSLERPAQATNLTDAEKAAIDYGERFATNHLSIDDAVYDNLRKHFTEAQIVELGTTVAFFVGFGRLAATWHMVEELPKTFQESDDIIAPWKQEAILVR